MGGSILATTTLLAPSSLVRRPRASCPVPSRGAAGGASHSSGAHRADGRRPTVTEMLRRMSSPPHTPASAVAFAPARAADAAGAPASATLTACTLAIEQRIFIDRVPENIVQHAASDAHGGTSLSTPDPPAESVQDENDERGNAAHRRQGRLPERVRSAPARHRQRCRDPRSRSERGPHAPTLRTQSPN